MADKMMLKKAGLAVIMISVMAAELPFSSFAGNVVSKTKKTEAAKTVIGKSGEISDDDTSEFGPGDGLLENKELSGKEIGEAVVLDAENAGGKEQSADIESEEKAILKTADTDGTKEETHSIEDNILEYTEIDELIHTYNSTVIKNRYELKNDKRKDKDADEVSDMLLDKANDYDSMADDVEDTNAILAASYRSQANSLRNNADDNATDIKVVELQYEYSEKTIASGVRASFISYWQKTEANEYAKANVSYLEKMLASARKKKAVGTDTELSVITAEESYKKAEAELNTNETGIAALKKNISVTCGWKYESNAEIATLPELDINAIDTVGFEKDLETALSKSYTIRLDRMKLDNVCDMSNYQGVITKYKDQLKTDEDQAKLSFKGLYNDLKNAKQAYLNAVNAKNTAEKNADTSKRSLSLGTVSSMEHETVLNALQSAKAAERSAYYSMYQAWAKYMDAVSGII